MQIVFRVDASIEIGTGHVMRCLTLAHALKYSGSKVSFMCRLHEGNLVRTIQDQGFEVYSLELMRQSGDINSSEVRLFHADWLGVVQAQDAEQCRPILQRIQPDWLIVDHYSIDQEWQAALKGCYRRLMVMDDLTDRAHLADLLLNQNYGAKAADYQPLVGGQCRLLMGANYALLRTEFAQWRPLSLARRQTPELKNVLITLGGADADNVTGAILAQLASTVLPEGVRLTVVMGISAVHKDSVSEQAARLPWSTQVLVNVSNMAELMCQADLAIGAAGATTWERCCLGLPTIQLVIAFNQHRVAEQLVQAGLVKTVDNLASLPLLLADAPNWMAGLSHKSAQVCDGLGCQRVVSALFE